MQLLVIWLIKGCYLDIRMYWKAMQLPHTHTHTYIYDNYFYFIDFAMTICANLFAKFSSILGAPRLFASTSNYSK